MSENENVGLISDIMNVSQVASNSIQDTIKLYEKQIYDLQQLLEISRSLCSTLEYSTLIESILYTCIAQMHVSSTGIFILDDIDSNTFDLSNNHTGMDLDPCIQYSISLENPMLKCFTAENTTLTIEAMKSILGQDVDIKELESLHPTLIVPLFHKSHMNGILVLGDRLDLGDVASYSEYDKSQIVAIASLIAIAINNASLLEKSSTDMMTHLKLKYFFYNVLMNKLDLAIEQKQPLAVLMFDIDFFKKFNDTWGHACGDFVLKAVAKIIKSNVREYDVASRYGGEEFTVMLPNTEKEDAMNIAERIRKKIEETDFCYEDQHMKCTISIGCAVYDSETNPVTVPKDLVGQADKALYASKRNGRNQVTFADSDVINNIEIPK